MQRIFRIALVVLVFGGLAVTCGGPTYDEPNSLMVPVDLVGVVVTGDATITIRTEVAVPDPPAEGEDPLERIELSIRGAGGGSEYMRTVYNASSWSVNPVVEFGLYPIGEKADISMGDATGPTHDADSLWGALQRDSTARDSDIEIVRLTWVVSLLDVPLGDFDVFAKAVPGRQRERDFVQVGSFTLGVEGLDDAGERRSVLDEVLSTGSVAAGDTEFTVAELWTLFGAAVQQPDSMKAVVDHAGELPFLRFLYLVAVRGTDPGQGTDLTTPALPGVDLAAAAIDPDPWIAAPALFLARKWGEALPIEGILDTLGSGVWDEVAVDQALLYLATRESQSSEPLDRISETHPEVCYLDILLADGYDDWTVRYQRPTKSGMEITTPEEPLYGWDGEMPTDVEPGGYRAGYLLGNPSVLAGPAQGVCPAGGSLRIVLWREGMV